MPLPPKVRPGDPIRSDSYNMLIDAFAELKAQVNAIGSGTGSALQVVITEFDPPALAAAGTLLTARGLNFAVPAKNNQVSIAGVVLPESNIVTAGSTQVQLRFVIPQTLPVPAGGMDAVIIISNGETDDRATYRITPFVPPVGPTPTITTIAATGIIPAPPANTLVAGRDVLVTGTGFGTLTSAITLNFTVLGTVFAPQAFVSVTDTQIQVTLPPMPALPAVGNRPVVVDLTVGSHPLITRTLSIRRS